MYNLENVASVTSSGAYELNHELQTPERVPIFHYREKTRIQIFYFDSDTTVPLQCAALVCVFWKAHVDRMSFGWLFFGIPIKFITDAYKTKSVTASISINAFRYFNNARFNFYKDDFAMHNFY